MEFFLKLFKPAPKDDSLLNMLLDNCVHLPIDNQSTQLFWKRPQEFRNRVLQLSAAHVGFTQNVESVMPTIHVMLAGKLNENMSDNCWQNFVQEMNGMNVPIERVHYDHRTLKATPDPQGCYFVDLMYPQALEQSIFIKTQDNAFCDKNPYDLLSPLRELEAKAVLVSGFFAQGCTKRTGIGACTNKLRTVLDPQMCYDEFRLCSLNRGEAFAANAKGVILTEPGQVAHVIAAYQAKLTA